MLSFALEQPIPSLAGYAWHARGYGDFWAHMLVAEGAVDGAVDAVGVKVWDLAAIQPIVEEAGGRFTRCVRRESHRRRHGDLLERAPPRSPARAVRSPG